jgi:hypothetical protein
MSKDLEGSLKKLKDTEVMKLGGMTDHHLIQ